MNSNFLWTVKSPENLRSWVPVLVLIWALMTGVMSFAGRDFQKDSEALVLGKIIADKKNHTIPGNYNLAHAGKGPLNSTNLLESYNFLEGDGSDFWYVPRTKSNFGLQSIFFSFLFNRLGCSLDVMKIICAGLTAFTLVVLSALFFRVFSPLFGVVFLGTSLLSPWLGWFGGNLYWVSFLWFLPAIFTSLMYLESRGQRRKILWSICCFFSFLIKDLTGFEYISTVVLFASAPFFVNFFWQKKCEDRWKMVKQGLVICMIAIGAFGVSLFFVASRIDGSLEEKLEVFYKHGFQRRGHGDPVDFDAAIAPSLAAKTSEVVQSYVEGWHTGVLWGIPPTEGFPILLVMGTLSLFLLFLFNSPIRWMSLGLFLVFLAAPLSWFVLGKAHSYVHRHMNYVLWYFGGVQTLIFCVLEFSLVVWRKGCSFFFTFLKGG